MRKMDFGEHFISYVTALNTNATSCVKVNNSCSRPFLISRSVRQGCPLSPLLFTLAIQVLTDAVNTHLQQGYLKGIDLHEIGVQYCQGYFVDDAHLLLSADRQVLLNAQTLLQSFGTASGLHVQWDKSKARWISNGSQRPDWTSELDWIWNSDNDVDKFLGFHFRDGLDEEGIYQAARAKIIQKINSSGNRSTIVYGRVMIANHIFYGIIWFVLPLWLGNRSYLRKLETLILWFVLGGNESTKTWHRVVETILHQKRQNGGIGLLSLQAQVQAFAAKTIRLKAAGLEDIGCITTDGNTSRDIHEATTAPINLTSPSPYAITPTEASIWCIRLHDEAPSTDSEITSRHARTAYKIEENILKPAPARLLPAAAEWTRAPIATCWTNQKKQNGEVSAEMGGQRHDHCSKAVERPVPFLSSSLSEHPQISHDRSSKSGIEVTQMGTITSHRCLYALPMDQTVVEKKAGQALRSPMTMVPELQPRCPCGRPARLLQTCIEMVGELAHDSPMDDLEAKAR
ncbi:hypothetical protein R1sor_017038 [Riccia sorocarpa]|uniref:Reverse transcriptase domain-containing protein n=1 Tax=Riccia sorocarpa TaxID=122646 RepID=A0ABD3I6T1_9MARC